MTHLSTATEAITFRDVMLRYPVGKGFYTVLEGFDMSIRKGEFLSLVGPSGCGKSTVLRLAAGLIPPSNGSIAMDRNQELRGFARVAMVFQRPNLLVWRNVLSNVLYPVGVQRRVTQADTERAMGLLQMVGMADWARRMPDELSGGMQQRVAICRALILDPEILLMDEPFSALDALTREELQFELRRMHDAHKRTTIFVTHSVGEAVLLSDRIAVMSKNRGQLRDLCEVDLPMRNDETASLPAYHEYSRRIRAGIYAK